MPLVRIDLPQLMTDAQLQSASSAVHQALVETFNVPAGDKFQALSRRSEAELVCSSDFLDVRHSNLVAFVQITCAPGRSVDMKKTLYAQIAKQLAAATGLHASDIIINLVESSRENWSFGNGVAQYAS
jgi:4-oxalocrotonate tautomerase